MERQHTLKKPVTCRGVGLHSGRQVTLVLHPAPAGSGVVFRRLDLKGREIPASWRFAVDRPLCTTLDLPDGTEIRTTEHLMCALYACGIDNVIADVDGPEIPILDGSAAPFVESIMEGGSTEQDAPRQFIEILKPVEFRHKKSLIRVTPADEFSLNVVLGVPGFGRMEWSGCATRAAVRDEIAPARTFGRLEGALPVMLASRLGGPSLLRGASLKNAVVFFRGHVLNRGGLRFPDEFVRHHTLDTIGDLSLAGATIRGHVVAEHSRHGLMQQFLKLLMSETTAWRYA
jgi:UDP-3-O-[3-hydroxymyristoyl] N-acetylglucosamine deacetylase